MFIVSGSVISKATRRTCDQIRMFAKELADLQPDVILGTTTPAIAAFQQETRTIPIVFASVSDPVGEGFVASLPCPGGNLTGFINIEGAMGGSVLLLAPAAALLAAVFAGEPLLAHWTQTFMGGTARMRL